MIEQALIHLNYIRKQPQTGSFCGMRYRLAKGQDKEEDCIEATVWPEPFCFVKTPPEQKTTSRFPLTQEGCARAVDWLNEQYSQRDWKGKHS
ncbi:MAG: hypothetical protein Q4C65_07885 [Eubacteriales bacterium]|nr:hypothetical protein [Eubacteriales bacterium]